MVICKECQKEFSEYDSLRRHRARAHQIHASQTWIDYMNNGVHPTCQCGCGEPVRWRVGSFQTYVNGHNAKGETNPMFGKNHSEEAKGSISKMRKEKFANGEYRVWQNEDTPETKERLRRIGEAAKKENNPERAKKISKALKGRRHTKEHREKVNAAIKKAWENPELRERQRHNRMQIIMDNGWQIKSKLEDTFSYILDMLNIKYHRQHYVREIKALYDFYLSDYNIIIETHGDFWHCNPSIEKFETPEYSAQISNIKRDKEKQMWCETNNIPLLIFWESDIKNNPQQVIRTLLDAVDGVS